MHSVAKQLQTATIAASLYYLATTHIAYINCYLETALNLSVVNRVLRDADQASCLDCTQNAVSDEEWNIH